MNSSATPYLDALRESVGSRGLSTDAKPPVRILLVEDDEPQLAVYQEIVTGRGFGPVLTARSAEEAARHYSEDPGSLLAIVDGNLDGSCNGPELCKLFRQSAEKEGRFLRLIFITGEDGFKNDALTHGADSFLRKPVQPEVLFHLLDRAGDEIREHEQTKQQLNDARKDPLTGLWLRRFFEERLGEELSRVSREGRWLSLLFIDLNHFKEVNDTHGHPAGDALLCFVAERIHHCTRPYDILGRIGGDEFMVALSDDARGRVARRMQQRIRKALETSFVCRVSKTGRTARLGVSAAIGHSIVCGRELGPNLLSEAARLVAEADRAMYLEKHGEPQK
jgi:two-component system, cell cycle response regulator